MSETISNLYNTLMRIIETDPRPQPYNFESMSMIVPGLYLGDSFAAMDLNLLQNQRFTHVLNMAEGYGIGVVNTNENYYRSTMIKYKGIPAFDLPSFPLENYFDEAVKFIQDALKSNGKILVHCMMGVSRSASIVIAYLIVTKKIRASEALKYVYEKRIVQPNEGFMEQLVKFSNKQEIQWLK